MNTSSTVRIYQVITHELGTRSSRPEGAADFYRVAEHDRFFTDDLDAAKADFNWRWNTLRHEGADGSAVEYELLYADVQPEDGEDAADVAQGLYTYVPKTVKWQALEDAGCPAGDASWCAFHMTATA